MAKYEIETESDYIEDMKSICVAHKKQWPSTSDQLIEFFDLIKPLQSPWRPISELEFELFKWVLIRFPTGSIEEWNYHSALMDDDGENLHGLFFDSTWYELGHEIFQGCEYMEIPE